MFGPGWLGMLLGLAFVVVAVVVLALRGGLPHALMALGMAAMAVPSLDPLPRPAWVVVFIALVVWAFVRLVRLGPAYVSRGPSPDPATWQRSAAARGYEFAAATFMLLAWATPHTHGPSLFAPLAWLLTATFLLTACYSFTRITRGPTPLLTSCTTVMATGMAAMALTMV